MKPTPRPNCGWRDQHGVSLIVVMLLLIVVSILGAGAAQIVLLGERSARNDRDAQVSWQAAEAALVDAAVDIRGSASSADRSSYFGVNAANEVNANNFVAGCGTSGKAQGLCALQNDATAKPIWLTVDYLNSSSTPAVPFGKFTGRRFTLPGSTGGIQPVRPPSYIIELVRDTGVSRDATDANLPFAFRVTAMGFGPRSDIQTVLQMVYRN